MSKFYVIYHNTEDQSVPMIKEFLENETEKMEAMVKEMKETETRQELGNVLDEIIHGMTVPVKFEVKSELSINYEDQK